MKRKFAIISVFLILAICLAGFALWWQYALFIAKPAYEKISSTVDKSERQTDIRQNDRIGILSDETIYINVNELKISPLYRSVRELSQAMEKSGYRTVLADKNSFASGNFNLYIAQDINHLPMVADKNAINVLWIPGIEETASPAPLRPFDVIVVKSISTFNHLKAINVRTAYIPDAFNIKEKNKLPLNGFAMFYGDNNGFSLSLYLAGRQNMTVDIYGKGFEKVWPANEIKQDFPALDDFARYAVVLIDQSDETVRDEQILPQIIEIIENGGIPYLRFNNGVYKIFGEALPMYQNEAEFIAGLKELQQNPMKTEQIRTQLKQISQDWNSLSQAKKFIEIFTIMANKRR